MAIDYNTSVGSGDLTTLRDTAWGVKMYLSVNPLNVVATARVNQASFETNFAELTVDNTSANWSDVRAGMSVLIGTTALGQDVGIFRVRDLPLSNTLYINETARADSGMIISELPQIMIDNMYLTVILDFNLWSVFPRITYADFQGTFLKDYDLGYGNQNSTAVAGILRIGDHRAGFVNNSGNFDCVFAADLDLFVADTVSSYGWELIGGGTVIAGATNTSTVTVRYTYGCYAIRCRVVLTSGAEIVAYRMIFAHDTTNYPPLEIQIQSDRLDKQGRQMSVRLAQTPTSTLWTRLTIGSMVVVWAETSLSLTADDTLQFCGFVSSPRLSLRTDTKNISFDVVSGYSLLKSLTAYSQELTYSASPTNWQQAIGDLMNVDYFVFYLLFYHTTALQLFDFYPSGLSSYQSNAWVANAGNFISQIDGVTRRVAAIFGQCSRGHFFIKADPLLIADDSTRNALAVRVTFTEDDLVSTELKRNIRPTVGTVVGYAFTTSVSDLPDAIHVISAGKVEGQGSGSQNLDGQLVLDMPEMQKRTANHRARLNNPWSEIPITLTKPFPVIEPCAMAWVQLTLSANYSPTNSSWSKRCLVTSISTTYGAGGEIRQNLTLEVEVNANSVPAEVIPITVGNGRDPDNLNLPEYDPITRLPLPKFDISQGWGVRRTSQFGVSKQTTRVKNTSPTNLGTPASSLRPYRYGVTLIANDLMITENITVANPVWNYSFNGDVDEAYTSYFMMDNFQGYATSPTGQMRLYLLTDERFMFNSDVFGTGIWTELASLNNTFVYYPIRSLGANKVGFLSYENAYADLYMNYWNGSSLTHTLIDTGFTAAMTGYDNDDFGLGVQIAAGASGLKFTSSFGGSWSAITGGITRTTEPLTCVRIPYRKSSGALNNTKTAIEFYYGINPTSNMGTLYRCVFNGSTGALASETDVSPAVAGATWWGVGADPAVEIYGGDGTTIMGLFLEDGVYANGYTLMRSTNAGASWTIKQASLGAIFHVHFVEPDMGGDGLKVYVSGQDVMYSPDGGTTLTTKKAGAGFGYGYG